jgi:hypothetical protein
VNSKLLDWLLLGRTKIAKPTLNITEKGAIPHYLGVAMIKLLIVVMEEVAPQLMCDISHQREPASMANMRNLLQNLTL